MKYIEKLELTQLFTLHCINKQVDICQVQTTDKKVDTDSVYTSMKKVDTIRFALG